MRRSCKASGVGRYELVEEAGGRKLRLTSWGKLELAIAGVSWAAVLVVLREHRATWDLSIGVILLLLPIAVFLYRRHRRIER